MTTPGPYFGTQPFGYRGKRLGVDYAIARETKGNLALPALGYPLPDR